MEWQTLVTVLAVGSAGGFLGLKVWRILSRRSGGCGCGCDCGKAPSRSGKGN